jgi:hypothetical protein
MESAEKTGYPWMEPTDKLDYPPDGIYTAAIYILLFPLRYLRMGSTEKLDNPRKEHTEKQGYPHMYSNLQVCFNHLHAAVSNWQPPDGIYREATDGMGLCNWKFSYLDEHVIVLIKGREHSIHFIIHHPLFFYTPRFSGFKILPEFSY